MSVNYKPTAKRRGQQAFFNHAFNDVVVFLWNRSTDFIAVEVESTGLAIVIPRKQGRIGLRHKLREFFDNLFFGT